MVVLLLILLTNQTVIACLVDRLLWLLRVSFCNLTYFLWCWNMEQERFLLLVHINIPYYGYWLHKIRHIVHLKNSVELTAYISGYDIVICIYCTFFNGEWYFLLRSPFVEMHKIFKIFVRVMSWWIHLPSLASKIIQLHATIFAYFTCYGYNMAHTLKTLVLLIIVFDENMLWNATNPFKSPGLRMTSDVMWYVVSRMSGLISCTNAWSPDNNRWWKLYKQRTCH